MGRPLSLVGRQAKGTAYFALVVMAAGAAKQIGYEFNQKPPTNEREWQAFFRQLIALLKCLDEIQELGRQGLEIAQGSGIINQTTDSAQAIEETIVWLQAELARLKQSE